MDNLKDIFISYSSKDEAIANKLCKYLEKRGIHCWIAPRDVRAGFEYGSEIVHAIKTCKVMVLLISNNSISSKAKVINEIEVAIKKEKIIIPFKIEQVILDGAFEFYLGKVHWIDAYNKPEKYFDEVRRQCLFHLTPEPNEDTKDPKLAEPVTLTERNESTESPTPGEPRTFPIKKIIAGIIILAILSSLVIFFWHHPVIDHDLIVIEDFNIKDVNGMTNELSSESLQYLLINNVLLNCDKRIITSKELLLPGAYYKSPQLIISGEIINKENGYQINIKYKKRWWKTIISYEFHDAAALLDPSTGIIPVIMNNIDGIYRKPNNRLVVLTKNWDAFISFFKGEKEWQKLEITGAKNHFKEALIYDNKFMLAKLRLAQLLTFNGNDLEAKEIIKEIKPQTSLLSRLDSLRMEALGYRLNGNFYDENNILKMIYNQYPDRKEFAYDVAESYFEKCDVGKAIEYYNIALKLDPNYALAHNHIAYCYSHLGDHKNALKHFKEYLNLDSTANSFDSYGDGLMTAGQLDSAEWAKKQGIILDSNLYYLWGSLGFIELRLGKFAEADQDFHQYINKADGNKIKATGYFGKALILFYERNYDKAIKLCQAEKLVFDTLDILTRDHEMHWLLGYSYLLLDRPEMAKAELKIMNELANDNHINATNYQKNFYKFKLHLESAIRAYNSDVVGMLGFMDEFDNSIKHKIKDHTSAFDLAFFNTSFGELMLWKQINRQDLAEIRFQNALNYNPNYAFALYDLWKLYDNQGRKKQADQYHERFKKVWKNADPKVKKDYGI